MSDKTLGEKVHQWLTNLVILIPLLSALVGGTIYGNSDTVKGWVHGKPANNLEDRLDKMQKQINRNTEWLK